MELSNYKHPWPTSEAQNYREIIRGIWSYMAWHHIFEFDTSSSLADDNPFAGPRSQPIGMISLKLLTDEWLCRKLEKLNIIVVEGYPSRSSEAIGLQKDQFVKSPWSQSKWFSIHTEKQTTSSSTTSYCRPSLNHQVIRAVIYTTSFPAFLPKNPQKMRESFQRVVFYLQPGGRLQQVPHESARKHCTPV